MNKNQKLRIKKCLKAYWLVLGLAKHKTICQAQTKVISLT